MVIIRESFIQVASVLLSLVTHFFYIGEFLPHLESYPLVLPFYIYSISLIYIRVVV